MTTKSKPEILLLKKRPSDLSDYKVVIDTRVNDPADIPDSFRASFKSGEEQSKHTLGETDART